MPRDSRTLFQIHGRTWVSPHAIHIQALVIRSTRLPFSLRALKRCGAKRQTEARRLAVKGTSGVFGTLFSIGEITSGPCLEVFSSNEVSGFRYHPIQNGRIGFSWSVPIHSDSIEQL